MKRYKDPKPLYNFMIDGYLHHGEADASAIDQLPFVITDLEHNPRQWKIWDKWLKVDTATPEQYERAKRFVYIPSHGAVYPTANQLRAPTGIPVLRGNPDYGIFVMPVVLVVVFSTVLIVSFLSYRRIKTVEQASIWEDLQRKLRINLAHDLLPDGVD